MEDTMKIDRVTVRFGMLRSEAFNNKKYEVELSAMLEPGESATDVKNRLMGYAERAVEDALNGHNEMNIPF